jgi:hypothetical protein
MKKFYKISFAFFILLFGFNISAFAQNNPDIKRTWHWYFGWYAGLDFSNGAPVAVTDGQTIVWKGCASISDTAGNLLFYTDNVSVWNKNHELMPNGSSIILPYANVDPTQILAVPQPGNDSIYYIFSLQYDTTAVNDEWVYSIVNMNLEGGLGDVISTQNFFFYNPTEKITAVKQRGSNDIWIIITKLHTNSFYAYLFTSTGISSSPVISNAGIVDNYGICYLTPSPDGSKLAVGFNLDGFEILDFNNKTGTVSNAITFPPTCSENYGIAFSPDSKKLYVASRYFNTPENPNHLSSAINQYNVTGDSATTVSSKILLDTIAVELGTTNDMTDALQLASDGKIYTTNDNTHHLGVINYPNIQGTACNYIDSAVYLMSGICSAGFPNYPANYFYFDSLYNTTSPDIEIPVSSSPVVSPNPFNNYTIVSISDNSNKTINFNLYNIIGQDVTQSINIEKIKNSQFIIKRQNLLNGIYFLKIKTNNNILVKKLILTN